MRPARRTAPHKLCLGRIELEAIRCHPSRYSVNASNRGVLQNRAVIRMTVTIKLGVVRIAMIFQSKRRYEPLNICSVKGEQNGA